MDYSTATARANSFRETINGFVWPHADTSLTAERLSDAGLYFCPVKKCPDQVQCYACGGKLAGFVPTDDPKVDHKTYYPNCRLSKSEAGGSSDGEEIRKSMAAVAINDLPEGWAEAKAPSGKVYYWNKVTMESSWSRPVKTVQDAPAQSLTSSIGLLKSLPKNKTYPASAYTPWSKPGSTIPSKLEEFGREFGLTAVEGVKRLYERHVPWHPRSRLVEPTEVVWEDVWSSKTLGSKTNNFLGTRDREGEMIIMHMIGRELRKQGKKFTDPTFPPSLESLFVYPSTARKHVGTAASERRDTSAFLAGLDPEKNIKWGRPSEVYGSKNVLIWSESQPSKNPFSCVEEKKGDKVEAKPDEINPEDVAQGRLGNCYFLSAICACATSEGDILLHDLIFEDYGDVGLYGVKFFVMGKWITVIVDDLFPMSNMSQSVRAQEWDFIFSSPKKSSAIKEIWPMVMEKAWAKLHGSYECTDAGENHDALEYLTGGVVKILQISENPGDPLHFKVLQDVLNEGDAEDAFVGCGDCGYAHPRAQRAAMCDKVGLVTGHAYAVLRAIEPQPGLRLVQVQNPWGSNEWNGKYSDKCECWTEELKQLTSFTENNEGKFFMEWSDFARWFGQCRIVDPRRLDKFTGDDLARVDGASATWVAGKSAGGADPSSSTFEFNPTFELTGSDTDVMLTLYQPDTRHLAVYDTWPMQQGPSLEISLWLGEKGRPKRKIHKLSNFDRFATCTQDLHVVEGRVYEILVAADSPGIEGAFAFTACGKHVELKTSPFKIPPPNIAALMAKREGGRWKGPNGESLSTFGV